MSSDWLEAGSGCTCWVNPNPYTHYGAVEPGDALEPNPDCPLHFPKKHEGEHCWHVMPNDVVCCGCVHADYKKETA